MRDRRGRQAWWLGAGILALVLVAHGYAQEPAAPAAGAPLAEPPASLAADEVLNSQPPLAPVEETRATLTEIMAQPKFVEGAAQPEPKETWLDRLLNWLERQGGFFGLDAQPWTIQALAAVLVLLLAYVVTRMAWEYFRRRDVRAPEETNGRAREPDAASLLAEARQALLSGDARLAIRLRFLALIKQLALPGSATRTNHQVTQWLKQHHPDCTGGFQRLSLAFEDAWYGGRPCGGGEYEYVDALALQVAGSLQDGEDAA